MNFINTHITESDHEPILRIWREINAREQLEDESNSTSKAELSDSDDRTSQVN